MKHTTLCYIERDGNYLMLHRTKKKMISTMISGSVWAENLKRMKVRRNVFCGRCGKRQD